MKTTTGPLALHFFATLTTAGPLPASQAPPAPSATPAQAPSAGDVIPAFDAKGVDGSPHRVEFKKGSRTVLVFFLSGCPSCHKMIPEWNRAFGRKPAGLDMVGVLMDQEPPGFFATIQVDFPVVRSPGRQFMDSLKVQRAPLTLRVAAGGKVEDVALGVIDPIRLGEFFRP
ncbi:MAG TPA: TlpA disulfide reductase family protein [Vicinamibacteria bacterium]